MMHSDDEWFPVQLPQHEHSSDNDDFSSEDDDDDFGGLGPHVRRRTRSFSEIMGRLQRSNEVAHPARGVHHGLHHRHPTIPKQESTDARRPLPARSQYLRRRMPQSRTAASTSSGASSTNYLLMGGIVLYFIMVLRGWQFVDWKDPSSPSWDEMWMPGKTHRLSHSAIRHVDTNHPYERQRILQQHEQLATAQRAQQRRRRTRPPPTEGTTFEDYDILNALQSPRTPFAHTAQPPKDYWNNQTQHKEICGTVRYGNASHDALSSESRVLITGILSNPLGFQLALALHKLCGVEVMMGVDAMYPNTVANRLALQERIAILQQELPKMIQPVILPHVLPKLLKSQKTNTLDALLLSATHELNWMAAFRPTHMVHLSSYDVWTTDSSRFFPIRSSLEAMEQLLASIATAENWWRRPHLVYATATRPRSHFQASIHEAERVLADTYHTTMGVYSVNVQLPNAVYGPWFRPGTLPFLERSANDSNNHNASFDLLHVNDAVQAIIGSMQYRSESSTPTVVAVQPESSNVPMEQLTTLVTSLLQPNTTDTAIKQDANTTSLKEGLLRTLAWQMDQSTPFGANESGDALLTRHNLTTCAADDLLCHSNPHAYLPCSSECSIKSQCLPSMWDPIRELVHELTEDCDIVLYTQSLDDDKDLEIHAEYMEDGDPMICNYAFLMQSSSLVASVLDKVPDAQLADLGVTLAQNDANLTRTRKLEGLNGRLLYRGWILVWIPPPTAEVSVADRSLLKLSPGGLFSSKVKYGFFIDERFPVSPNIDDVSFLIGEMHRPALKQRSVYRKVTNEHGHEKKVKYKLAAEPERRAAILLAPMKFKKSNQTEESKSKVSVRDATKFMRYEMGMDPVAKEPPNIKKQREFYERAATFINRGDMRSPMEPWYRYKMKHWIRSRWIVHDMQMEESRLLRCDWYQEHVQWKSDLDQLSFAHVMARRELKRRMDHQEPDDHFKSAMEKQPELQKMTDANEWHAVESKHYTAPRFTSKYAEVVPDHIARDEHVPGETTDSTDTLPLEHPSEDAPQNEVPIFVRIISDRILTISRRLWAKRHKNSSKKESEPK